MIRQGTWCDLALRPSDVAFVRTLRNGEVVCETAEPTPLTIWRRIVPGGELLYLSAAADGTGIVGVIGKSASDGHARLMIDGEHLVDLGETAAIFGTLLVGLVDGFTAYVLRTSTSYDEIRLTRDGRRLFTIAHPIAETSQGFVQVRDGAPVPQDAARVVHGLSLPSRAGSVWVGQSRTAATIALYDETTGRITPLDTLGGQPPHIVDALDGSYYVCSWTEPGPWWVRVRRPFGAVAPPPVEPPPVIPPKETPVQLESKHSQLIEEFAGRFGLPGFSKEEGQAWVAKLAGTMKARWPSEGWGTKRASSGRPLSNESIARPANGRLWGYDLIIGAGAPGQRLESHAHAEDITDQVFVSVESKDWLAGSGGTPNPGTPTPPAGKPIPEAYMPWDVQVDILTQFIAGIWPKDRVPEVTETGLTGSGTLSRGALGFLIPIQFKTTVAWMNAHGQRAPVGLEWWDVAAQAVAASVAEYRRSQPTP